MKCINCKERESANRRCQLCNSCRLKKWRKDNPKKVKAYRKMRYERDIKKIKAYQKGYQELNKEKFKESNKIKKRKQRLDGNYKFRNKVRAYTNNHIKKKDSCEKCGASKNLEFHHLKYTFPVNEEDVFTLCRKCHRKIHQKYDFAAEAVNQEQEESE